MGSGEDVRGKRDGAGIGGGWGRVGEGGGGWVWGYRETSAIIAARYTVHLFYCLSSPCLLQIISHN